ncbi:hypothetical protein HMPREF1250_0978 [Megasphaera vaginalis (ex Srinivasan et al. 2021)]|uniref:Uncharacterized protein n=1 Tax=Megasphaera vaginalis (ex Srinivasan et al. 2021) TaxID=1111454 RepID=U7ULS8_9FIRM|nr:hypothetical protein HMPREF1250_0978 [Megasphaera vaginalis (ex Srinivasan et al. 2021)]
MKNADVQLSHRREPFRYRLMLYKSAAGESIVRAVYAYRPIGSTGKWESTV